MNQCVMFHILPGSFGYSGTASHFQVPLFSQEGGVLVLPTVGDPPVKRNSRKHLSAEFHDRALVLSSISSMSGCCQVIDS